MHLHGGLGVSGSKQDLLPAASLPHTAPPVSPRLKAWLWVNVQRACGLPLCYHLHVSMSSSRARFKVPLLSGTFHGHCWAGWVRPSFPLEDEEGPQEAMELGPPWASVGLVHHCALLAAFPSRLSAAPIGQIPIFVTVRVMEPFCPLWPPSVINQNSRAREPTWCVEQAGPLAVVGHLLLTVLRAVNHGLQLPQAAPIVQGHGVGLLWAGALHMGQLCVVVLHRGPNLVLCPENTARGRGG